MRRVTRRLRPLKTRRRNKKRVQRGGQEPTPLFRVSFAERRVNGAVIPIAMAQQAPTTLWEAPEDGSLRTLLAHDPDATAPSWIHWLVINSNGKNTNSGQEVMSWAPPSPPPGTGEHRYMFTLYSHTYPIHMATPSQRGNFDVAEFEKIYGLKKLTSTYFKASAGH